jgi:cell fate (sporulation/competence/biofilm development) regulator YlbF (YheA/YmcA/DUF963 family)
MLEKLISNLIKKEINLQFGSYNKSITLLENNGLDFEKSLTITPKDGIATIELTPIIYQSQIARFPSVDADNAFANVVHKIKAEYDQIKIEVLEMDLNSYYDDSKLNQYFTLSIDAELSENTDMDSFINNLNTIQVEFQSLTDLIIRKVSKAILAMAVNYQLAKAA